MLPTRVQYSIMNFLYTQQLYLLPGSGGQDNEKRKNRQTKLTWKYIYKYLGISEEDGKQQMKEKVRNEL